MNLPQFLRQVDKGAAEMSRERLEVFIHELARTLPENRRNDFLSTMHKVHAEGNCFAGGKICRQDGQWRRFGILLAGGIPIKYIG